MAGSSKDGESDKISKEYEAVLIDPVPKTVLENASVLDISEKILSYKDMLEENFSTEVILENFEAMTAVRQFENALDL